MVRARADGKYAFSATMEAHTTRTVEGVKEVNLLLGNAGGVTISLNGKPTDRPGRRGRCGRFSSLRAASRLCRPRRPRRLRFWTTVF